MGEGEETIFDSLGERPKMAEIIDWKLESLNKEENTVKLSFQSVDLFTNPVGFTHGGFVVAMLDECMGSSVVGVTDAKYFSTTISLSADFIKPVPLGRVFGTGRITSMKKSIAFLEASLTNEDGELLARATGSYKLIPFDPKWIKQ